MTSKVQEKASRLVWLIRNGRIPQAIGFASQFVIGRSVYTDHLATYFASDQLPVIVEGNTMYLSADDAGISTELFHFGTRERAPTAVMRRAFEGLKRTVDEPVVLEIGAHRGYYTFQAADILSGNGTIYAIEPNPDNFEALNKGVEENGFENVITDQCAIGETETVETLKTAVTSNSHTLQEVSESMEQKYTGESVETVVQRIDTYLEDNGVSSEEVDIVKIDVEGYERAAFEGMEGLLDADSELLVFLEIHPHRVDPDELCSIVDAMEAADFELVHASSSADSDLPSYGAVKEHIGVPKGRHSVDLIVKRYASDQAARPTRERDVPEVLSS